MKLFSRTAYLNRKKSNILGVFTKMQTNLEKLHSAHDAHQVTLQQKIADLQQEHAAVSRSKAETAKVLSKIDDILN